MKPKNQETIRGILSVIEEYSRERGTSPSVREIAAALGVDHSTVTRYMQYMREEGMLSYSGHRGAVTAGTQQARAQCSLLPLVGSIACGRPILAEENIEEYIPFPASFLGRGEYFILRARGDSMINAGIDDGDLVIIRRQNTAEYNQIVAALVEDEATLKRFRPKGGVIYLHPENPLYEDIIPESCILQGVAVKVLKDLM